MRTFIFTAICLFSLVSCKKTDEINLENPAFLRIENTGNLVFDSVKVNSPGGSQTYYNAEVNSPSGYKKFNYLYRYASIEIYFGNQTAKLQPFDYVGENMLYGGNHTYSLLVISTLTSNSVTLTYRKD